MRVGLIAHAIEHWPKGLLEDALVATRAIGLCPEAAKTSSTEGRW